MDSQRFSQCRSTDWPAFADSGLLPLLVDFCSDLSTHQQQSEAPLFLLEPEAQLFLRDVITAGLSGSASTGTSSVWSRYLIALFLQMFNL
jgi:hypothetical protein